MKRFYPDALPPFPGEPSPDKFIIRRVSTRVGEGVCSLVRFREGDVLFSFSGFLVPEITQYSLQITSEVHIHDPYFMGKVLHSCQPNSFCDIQRRIFVAVAPIAPGDLITMDYAQTEDRLYKPFHCSCGAADCRGFVVGREEMAVKN